MILRYNINKSNDTFVYLPCTSNTQLVRLIFTYNDIHTLLANKQIINLARYIFIKCVSLILFKNNYIKTLKYHAYLT